jgi:uracil-DNA glycosylase
MTGFFDSELIKSNGNPTGKTLSCPSCGLYRNALSPKMKPFGNFGKRILNIGEGPGETEDQRGKPWQGRAGRTLQRMYKKLGIDLFKDCLNINAVNCRPMDKKGNNKTPTNHEIACCRQKVIQTIKEYKPHLIIVLGNIPVESILGHRWKKDLGGITKWRGWTIPDRDFKAWVCPTFHPSYIMRMNSQEVDTIWKQDLEQAFSMLKEPFPNFPDERNQVEIIDSPMFLDPFTDLVAIDYETTGLKPHAAGHRIVCASVAYNEKHVQVFMMPSKRSERHRFIDLLKARDTGKMAHNMKFEEVWSSVRLKQSVNNWQWDSMLAAHILDNRPGITGLKFQAYINFGIVDYDSFVSSYLKSKDSKDGNGINRIVELINQPGGKEELMLYCGLDSLLEYKLAIKQMKEIHI